MASGYSYLNQSHQEDDDRYTENELDKPMRLKYLFEHLPFSVRFLDRFSCFTHVNEGHFMLRYKEEFLVELSLHKV